MKKNYYHEHFLNWGIAIKTEELSKNITELNFHFQKYGRLDLKRGS